MNTKEIDGRTYTMNHNKDGSITLVPIPEPKKARKPRCGDVRIGTDSTRCVRIRTAPDSWHFDDGIESICDDVAALVGTKLLFNAFNLAAAFPDGIPDPSELVRKSDVVAALSIEDEAGDSVISGRMLVYAEAIEGTRAALAALGITPKKEQK